MRDWNEDLHAALSTRYRLVRRLGRGGTADVFLATDVKHDRSVALKVLRPELADGVTVRRFEGEIALVARLMHPHILALLDSGEAAGLPYFVSPYVQGESLDGRLAREHRLPVPEAVRLICEIADALDYAHSAGVIHRDVKPANVLLVAQHAIVADFGAGWMMRQAPDDRMTQTGCIVGTLSYMSPEQGAGERDLDGRSDEYSVALMLHELVAGTLPFTGAGALELLSRRFTTKPIALREVRPEVPARLEQTVLRALSLAPDDRFPTMGQFAEALRSESSGVEDVPRPRESPSRAATPPNPSQPVIAVLPFATLSADRDDEYLACGLAEEITSALSRLRSLRVAARTPCALRSSTEDVLALGARLGATVVMQGTVQRAGGRIRLHARLVSTSDGHQIWAKQFLRGDADVFALQEELAQSVVAALQVDLLGQSGRAIVGVPTPVAAAHDQYLRGRFAWGKRTETQLEQSIRLFDSAIELDPEFAAAHAAAADAYITLCVYGSRGPKEVMPVARRAAARALAIDPTAAEPHVSIAQILAVHDWDWSAAEAAYRRALALDPGSAPAHQSYAMNVLSPRGMHDEALRYTQRALELEPLSAVMSASVGVALFAARRYGDSILQYERTLELEPNFSLAHYFMGQALVQLGSPARAMTSFERAIELGGRRLEVVSALAHASATSGDSSRALLLLEQLRGASARRYVSPYLLAQVYLGLGKDDDALSALERAVDERATDLVWLGVRGIWDRLRDTSRFQAIARAVLGP